MSTRLLTCAEYRSEIRRTQRRVLWVLAVPALSIAYTLWQVGRWWLK